MPYYACQRKKENNNDPITGDQSYIFNFGNGDGK